VRELRHKPLVRDRASRPAAARPADHPLLALQRQAGNRAVASTVTIDGVPRLQRFAEGEHKAMGDAGSGGAGITLPGGLTVTFGDVTALAGDYFGSMEQLRDLAKVQGDGTKPGTRDEVEFALHVEIRKDRAKSDFGPDVAVAVTKRYYALAGTNLTHFTEPRSGDSGRSTDELAKARGTVPPGAAGAYGVTPGTQVPVTNVGSYRANHEKALETAARAGAGGGSMDDALLYEAFSSHFLTDAYSAGHLRTPRAAVGDWWNARVPMFWTNLQLWMAEVIAKHINDHSVAGYVQTVQQLYEAAQDTLREATKVLPALTFGDAVGGALHDIDNEQGVVAQVGSDVVRLVGDGQVLDSQRRALVAGVPTAEKAAAGVRVSLQEVRDAFTAGAGGAAPAAAVAAARLPDGLFRAEQLWPRALADADPRQTNPARNWQVETAEQLFADARMRTAFTHFAHEKADTLGGSVAMEPPFKADKAMALKEAVVDRLKGDEATVIGLLRAVINYTPGSATGQTGGVFGHDSDDDALSYYRTARTAGALDRLTLTQRTRLVRLVLEGATTGPEDTMVADLLTSKPADAPAVIEAVSWRWIWDDLSGGDLRRVIDGAGPLYWKGKSLDAKKREVKFLADGPTGDLAQRTIIVILSTCANPAEVRAVDSYVGWPGLDWDLSGRHQSDFDALKR
jgi:hypothetical protein